MLENTDYLQGIIEKAFSEDNFSKEIIDALEKVLKMLSQGNLRIAEKKTDKWIVNQWIKKAILMSFKIRKTNVINNCGFDKFNYKFSNWDEKDFLSLGARVIPGAIVREGAYIGKNVVLMPCFINIGAFVDDNTMIDTWATIGSCAQIGKNCHIAGGVGIGGVLEPPNAQPVIIEDDCFIGGRVQIVEGMIIKKGSVIATGISLSASTPIIDVNTGNIYYNEVPPYSVIVPGSRNYKDGFNINCALIIKKVDENTRKKTEINDILRTEC